MSLKDNIIETSMQLFLTHGIKRVSMDDTARKANVSKRTLYDFFKDKESLLEEVIEKIYDEYFKQLEVFEKGSKTALDVMLLFNEKITNSSFLICEDFYEDLKRYSALFEKIKKLEQLFLDKIFTLFEQGARQGVFLDYINYDMISFIVREEIGKHRTNEAFKQYTKEDIHNTFFYIVIRGICTDKGRKILKKFITGRQNKKELQLYN